MGPSMRGRSWLRFRRMPVRARRCWRILSSFAGSRSEAVRRVSLNSWKKMSRLSGKNCSGESGSLSHSQAKNSWLLRMSFCSGWQRRSSCSALQRKSSWSGWKRRSSCSELQKMSFWSEWQKMRSWSELQKMSSLSALQKMSSLSGKMRKSCSGWQKRSSGSALQRRSSLSELQKMNSLSALQKRSFLSGWQTLSCFRNFSGPLRMTKNRHGMMRMNCVSLSRKSSSAGSSSSERRKPYLKNSAKMKMLKNFWLLCFWRFRKNSWSGHRVPYLRTSLLSRRWKLLII